MEPTLTDKLTAAISPATSVENISLDYNSTLYLGDVYEYTNTVIGAGGFGVVILAIDRSTREEVAIKILNIQRAMLLDIEDQGSTMQKMDSIAVKVERSLRFMENEVSIMRQVAHPNVMRSQKVLRVHFYFLGLPDTISCAHYNGTR